MQLKLSVVAHIDPKRYSEIIDYTFPTAPSLYNSFQIITTVPLLIESLTFSTLLLDFGPAHIELRISAKFVRYHVLKNTNHQKQNKTRKKAEKDSDFIGDRSEEDISETLTIISNNFSDVHSLHWHAPTSCHCDVIAISNTNIHKKKIEST